jgi:hypothetical protein
MSFTNVYCRILCFLFMTDVIEKFCNKEGFNVLEDSRMIQIKYSL